MREQTIKHTAGGYQIAALFTLALRVVAGWTYFSAFWRRLILENKFDPEGAGYIGEKFNHFLPNALGIGPLIEYLVSHPELLWWFMLIFTIVEAVVGLFLMLGLFTRLMSIGMMGLAMGILLGAGWLGTTCLDEWQIGVLGIAAGFTIFLSGGGRVSLDWLFFRKMKEDRFLRLSWAGSGPLGWSASTLNGVAMGGAILIVFLTLFTNQYFHGGLWGTLHNKSVRPHVNISNAHLDGGSLRFTVFRVEGADVYGSFLIGISLKDSSGKLVLQKDASDLASLPVSDISNYYVAKVKPGKHSLLIPLGAKADLNIKDRALAQLPAGSYQLELTDISGIVWQKDVVVE